MRLASWVSRAVAAALVLGLCLAGTARADEKDKKDKDKSDKQPTVIQLDLNKLPPDVAKRLLEIAGKGGSETAPAKRKGSEKGAAKKTDETKKTGGKVISLTDAIAIAEKAGQGQAVKAERKGEGEDTHFNVEVVGKGGEKTKIELTATGERRAAKETTKGPPGKPGKKPGKDKEDDD